MAYKKLSPRELRARGLSPKSERYVDSRTGEIISKRQYQQKKLAAKHGKRITLEQRAVNFFKGIWRYLTRAIRKAAARRSLQARRAARKGARTPREAEALARWADMSRRRGEWNREDWVNFEEDKEDFGEEMVVEAIYPETKK